MHKLYKLFFILFLIGLWLDVHAQQNHVLVGRTLSIDQAEVVQLASVYNINSGMRKISNRSGYFAMPMLASDTIVITSIAYDSVVVIGHTLTFEQNTDTILVLLKPKNVRLKEVKILSSNPKRDSLARAAAEFLKNDPLMNNYSRILDRPRGSIMSPLTAIYQQFSKEGRDAAHFEDFMAYMEEQKKVDRIFNRALVLRATKIQPLQVDEFMLFCKPGKAFILSASQYDLIKAIQTCERIFNERGK
jgi:hypothetical protein